MTEEAVTQEQTETAAVDATVNQEPTDETQKETLQEVAAEPKSFEQSLKDYIAANLPADGCGQNFQLVAMTGDGFTLQPTGRAGELVEFKFNA
jgi:hypothetical protein